MNRRVPVVVALVAFLFAAAGLIGIDYPLARWIRSSGFENAALFVNGIEGLDALAGIHYWYWLAASVFIVVGTLALIPALRAPRRLAIALLTAGLVQVATLHTMIFMKGVFGRLRPHQVLDSGNWDVIWNAGGGSFPSGHSAYFFGLLLPLAAFATRGWLRALLIAIPVFVAVARLNLEKHFLSDVATSAVIAALYTLLAAFILKALQRRRRLW